MLNYLLDLFYQAEESIKVAESDNQMLASCIHQVSDELYDLDQILEFHFKNHQTQNNDGV